jgi:hypothetical protein
MRRSRRKRRDDRALDLAFDNAERRAPPRPDRTDPADAVGRL